MGGRRPGHFSPSQFESAWNVEANCATGSGRRSSLAFREANADARLFAMEPSESTPRLCGEVGEYLIEGIFARQENLVDTTLAVDSEEAVERCAVSPRPTTSSSAPTPVARHHRERGQGYLSQAAGGRNPVLVTRASNIQRSTSPQPARSARAP